MRNVPVKFDEMRKRIFLGVAGENLATQLDIDCSSVLAVHPDAIFSVLVRRREGENSYPAMAGVVPDANGMVQYSVTSTDTAYAGWVLVEIQAIQDNMIAKTCALQCHVRESLDPQGDIPAPPTPGWVQMVMDAAARSETSAATSASSAEEASASKDAAAVSAKASEASKEKAAELVEAFETEEAARQRAEAERAREEAARETAEAQRQQDTADAIGRANTATTNANTAAQNATDKGNYAEMQGQLAEAVIDDVEAAALISSAPLRPRTTPWAASVDAPAAAGSRLGVVGDADCNVYHIGKNIFDYTAPPNSRSNLTSEVIDGGIRCTTTATGNASITYYLPLWILGRTITVQARCKSISGDAGGQRIWVHFGTGSNTSVQTLLTVDLRHGVGAGTVTIPLTLPDGAEWLALRLYANYSTDTATAGAVVEFAGIQMELGDTATPYQPFVGSETLTLTANQPITTKAYGDDHLVASAGNIQVTYSQSAEARDAELFVPVSDTAPVASLDGIARDTQLGIAAYVTTPQEGVPSPDAPIPIEGKESVTATITDGGDRSYTLTHTPPKPLYGVGTAQDSWEPSIGRLTRRLQDVVFDGTEGWSISPATGAGGITLFSLSLPGAKLYGASIATGNAMCDSYNLVTTGFTTMQIGDCRIGTNSSQTATLIYLATGDTTVEELQARLAANPIKVAYELATPIVTYFEPIDTPSWPGTNTVYTDAGGDTEISGWQEPVFAVKRLQEQITALQGQVTGG